MPNQLPLLEQAKSTFIDLAIKFGPRALVAILILAAGIDYPAFVREIGVLGRDAL
jgi:hypothetical protein